MVFYVFSNDKEILGLLRVEQVCKAILFAALRHLLADFRIIKMDLVSMKVEIDDFILPKDREIFLKSFSICSLFRSGIRDFLSLARFCVGLRQLIQRGLVVPQVGIRFRL